MDVSAWWSMQSLFKHLLALIGLVFIGTGCAEIPLPTPTATYALSAPTLEPSPTVHLLTSDELYGDSQPFGQSEPTAASVPSRGALPPLVIATADNDNAQRTQLILQNGSIAQADLYETIALERVAGILLLSRTQGAWGTFPRTLSEAGYTVLAVELPTLITAQDIVELLTSLGEVASVDPSRIAVIAEDISADDALLGCSIDLMCDALIMISPNNRETVLNVAQNYRPRPLLLIASKEDAVSYPVALAINGTVPESTFIETNFGRGAGLLTLEDTLVSQVILWLEQALTPQ